MRVRAALGFPLQRCPLSRPVDVSSRVCGRPAWQVLVCHATAPSQEPAQDALIQVYTYNDADGKRQKATIEHVFTVLDEDQSQPSSSAAEAPWAMGWQMNERNLVWNDRLKVNLIKRIASNELGISSEEMDWRLSQLNDILPGLDKRLSKAPPKLVARLAAQTGDVAQRLLTLKEVFPKADVAAMVNNRLGLLLEDNLQGLQASATRLRELLPEINVDKFVETFPLVLDVQGFEVALEDAKRIMPDMNVTTMLRKNPDMILSLVKGKNLIPYDEFANPWS